MNTWRLGLTAVVLALASLAPHSSNGQTEQKKAENRVFELRTYYITKGKMDAINARFRDHTTRLFQKHGMEVIGYWTDSKEGTNKLIYILAHKSKAAADASWKAFGGDPEWKKAAAESEKGGKLMEKFERVWMNPTDY